MSEIPRDIMAKAIVVADREVNFGSYEVNTLAVARAILTERKRCAEVARSHGDTWSGSRDAFQCVQESAVDDKCEEIAQAIEAGQ